jgi:iron complex transport system ATP-binding protein
MMLLQAKDIEVSYDRKEVLKGVNIEVYPGEIVTIVGPNGSGKSTILKVMSRALKPKKGEVLLGNKNISSVNTKDVAKRLALLPQANKTHADFTVETLVSYGRYPHLGFGSRMTRKDYEIIDWAIDKTDLSHLRNRFIKTLSGGERQRAWIAMALAQKTDILLLDEPTTFLDICYQLEILELLKELNRKLGLTIVMVLHDLNQAVRYSDRVYALKDGVVQRCSSSHELLSKDFLREVFRIEVDIMTDETSGCHYFIPQRVI